MSKGLCEGRVVVVTGAGRGIGREHALEFGRQGAHVIVNDLGTDLDGSGRSSEPAEQVVQAIKDAGGAASANADDVSDPEGAKRLVDQAVDEGGRLDVLVNNAGILRDRTITNMTIEEWDAVIHVHLRGMFAPTHFAANHWRARSKAGEHVDGRLINTASPAIYGHVGQANYGAAKGGVLSFTLTAAMELDRYGVTANAIVPGAATRMTETIKRSGLSSEEASPDDFDPRDPANIAPLVAWLGSSASAEITGRAFAIRGSDIAVLEGWSRGPEATTSGRWSVEDIGERLPSLVSEARPNAGLDGRRPEEGAKR